MIEEIMVENLNTGKTITIGMDAPQEFWLVEADWSQVQGSHISYQLANQQGERIIGTSFMTRPLSITGWVAGDPADIVAKCAMLNQFITPVQDYRLHFGEYVIGFRPDRSIVYGKDVPTNNAYMRQFLIQATCPFPFFTRFEPIKILLDSSEKQFRFPTDFGRSGPMIFATVSRLYNFRVNNPGGISAGVTVEIRFTGVVSNPKIRDLSNGKFLGVKGVFSSGEVLTISTSPGEKAMTLTDESGISKNIIKDREPGMTWLQLAPGQNTWAIECEDPTARINMLASIYFSPLYLEVE